MYAFDKSTGPEGERVPTQVQYYASSSMDSGKEWCMFIESSLCADIRRSAICMCEDLRERK